jgi:paraquat-inducible protein B
VNEKEGNGETAAGKQRRDSHAGNAGGKRRRTSSARAKTERSWWPGWIWAVPLAALGIGAWLLIRFLTQGGTDITITFPDAAGLTPGDTSIVYRGMMVGSVGDVSLSKDGNAVRVSATMKDSASQFLKTGTIFWLRGANPSLSNLSSLGAVLSGPTIVMEPGPGKSTTHFNGLSRKPAVPGEHGTPVLFRMSFDGAVGDLDPGDAVKLRGFAVGEVEQIGFHYDAKTGAIETPVTVALYPSLFHVEGAKRPDSAVTLRAALDQLISKGLRASLDREPPLIGSYRVALEMAPGAPKASMNVSNGLPEIPTAPGGGLDSIVSRLKTVPIDQIAQNLLDATHQIDQLVSSPELEDSIAQLDSALQQIHQTVKNVGPKIDQLVQTLRGTAQQFDQTASAADRAMGGPRSQNGLHDTLREMEEAARAVRSLADYLERHPESILSGKPGR